MCRFHVCQSFSISGNAKMNPLEQALEQYGFRQHDRPFQGHEKTSSTWQRRIKAPSGETLYFVNAFFYEKFQPGLPDQIEFETRLYPSLSSKYWITIQFHGCDSERDINAAMEFFRHAYNNLWCQPDPHNR